MICKKCGHEISDEAKFCENCGAKVEQEVEEIVEPIEIVDKTEEVHKEWYYVENNDSKGPYSQKEMETKIEEGLLQAHSLVWKASMTDWQRLEDTELKEYLNVEKDSNKNWYYVDNNESKGPFSKEQMLEFIENQTLTGNSFVWKTGMDDWVRLKNTELVQNEAPHVQSQPVFTAAPNQVQTKNIGLSVILTLITCGIYGFYWLYCIARDLNELTVSQNQEKGPDAGLVVILSIVTCGIYLIYYFWKAGKMVSSLTYENGTHPSDDSIVLMVLSILQLSIVSYCILQSNINGFAQK